MSEKKKNKLPAGWVRIPAAVLALLLTMCLFGTQLSLMGLQVMTSAGLHRRAALAADVVDLQTERIARDVKKLAAEHGFDPEPILAAITRDEVEQMDRDVVDWWTGGMAEGKLGEEPVFDSAGIEKALRADRDYMSGLDPLLAENTLSRVAGDIGDRVRGSAVLFRDMLVEAGARIVGERVNLPQAVALLRKVPLALGLAGLLLAGLIALLMSRRIGTAGQFIGGALAACGLLAALMLLIMKMLNLRGMIAEASALLEAQYAHLAGDVTLEALGIALALIACGVGLMLIARRETRKYGT